MTVEERPDADRDDDVARLLKLAGARPPVAEARAVRVRQAAREAWQERVRATSRRRALVRTAALAAAASVTGVVLWVGGVLRPPVAPPPPVPVAARVESVVGEAWLRAPDGPTPSSPAGRAAVVPAGGEITTAARGRLAASLPSGHSVRLDGDTRVRVAGADEIVLDVGTIYVDSGVGPTEGPALVVRAAEVEVRESGTQFEVRLHDGSVRVRLREGGVVVRHENVTERVDAGTEIVIGTDGAWTRRTVDRHGRHWDWIAAVAPMPELDGRPVREFLHWVARERGWVLTFSDEATEQRAERVVLGPTGRLTLESSLDAVLPTCLLDYRVDDGTLIVMPAR